MKCPSCQSYLRSIVYEGIEIESCDRCGGEWLDSDEIKKITDIREQQFDAETRRAINESHSYDGAPDRDMKDRDLMCPKCGSSTDPINYGGGTGLIIDRCSGCHGVWLDDQELEKVQMIVESWADALSDDLQKYGGVLSDIAVVTETLDETDEQTPSKIPFIGPFINACVNGIIRLH